MEQCGVAEMDVYIESLQGLMRRYVRTYVGVYEDNTDHGIWCMVHVAYVRMWFVVQYMVDVWYEVRTWYVVHGMYVHTYVVRGTWYIHTYVVHGTWYVDTVLFVETVQ